ncbi:YppG-like protein [Pelagirhabdus alkalitolerans]|uniref:YppG-like protein n=1 Tax=Pelagirhabdus alkalitolerans TaxID=1612202 RepID=A0A1G6JI00_9BACI|nr:YppG family protein [Pelagirhabdus alkalitolerans]SDC17546.1 YppG-like protein [Pelagirhabdus alkalitolerans]
MKNFSQEKPPYSHNEWMYDEMNQPNETIPAYFQNHNGQLDVEKVIQTISQVAETAQQFTPLVKEIQSLIKKT